MASAQIIYTVSATMMKGVIKQENFLLMLTADQMFTKTVCLCQVGAIKS